MHKPIIFGPNSAPIEVIEAYYRWKKQFKARLYGDLARHEPPPEVIELN